MEFTSRKRFPLEIRFLPRAIAIHEIIRENLREFLYSIYHIEMKLILLEL